MTEAASDVDLEFELIKSKSETVGSSVACDGSNVGDSERVGATEGLGEGLLLGAITGCEVGASVLRNSASQESPP